MNRRRALLTLAAALAAYGCNAPGNAAQNAAPGEYVVTLVPAADAKTITDVYGRLGVRSVKPIGNNAFLVTFGADPGLATMEKLAAGSTAIQAVQPNYRYRAR